MRPHIPLLVASLILIMILLGAYLGGDDKDGNGGDFSTDDEDDNSDGGSDGQSSDDEDDGGDDYIGPGMPEAHLTIRGLFYYIFEDYYVMSLSDNVIFYTSDSVDHDGEIMKYMLSMGDGHTRDMFKVEKTEHSYRYPGRYNTSLTVVDDDGKESTTYRDIVLIEAMGSWANEIITSDEYKKIHLEVDLLGDVDSSDEGLEMMEQRIEDYCSKRDGVTVTVTQETTESIPVESNDDLMRAMIRYRDGYSSGNSLVIHMLYFDHDAYVEGGLGVAFESTSIAMFRGDDFQTATMGPYTEEQLEEAVHAHEFFHLCGLVNIGYQSGFPHESRVSEGHCNNDNCVMYFTVDTVDVVNLYTDSLPNDLCRFCVEDMGRYG